MVSWADFFFAWNPIRDWAIKMVIDFLLRKWWSYSKDVLQKYHDFSFGEPGLQKLDWFFFCHGRRVVILCKNGMLQMWWSKGFFRFGFLMPESYNSSLPFLGEAFFLKSFGISSDQNLKINQSINHFLALCVNLISNLL